MVPTGNTAPLLNRRSLLVGGAGLAATGVTSCDLLSTDPDGGNGGADGGADGSRGRQQGLEAPELAELVEAGELPPVEQRLPSDPLVVEPTDQGGPYGGTWRTALLGPADTSWLTRTIGYDYLLRWNFEWTETVPNIAESVRAADNGREYVFNLRPGTRWSSGQPFTADDIIFAYEDVLRSSDIFPEGPPSAFIGANGEGVEIDKADEHAVRFIFPTPKPLFLEELSSPYGGPELTSYPRHFLEQFHKKYNSAVGELVEQASSSSWGDLFLEKSDIWTNPDLPTLFAWVPSTALGMADRIIADRNPFYWKTDTDGRQLP